MPKTINSLMKHLRDNSGVAVSGSKHKTALSNYGYYHGYKGYRFYKEKNNYLNISNFDEIIALNEFDLELKSVFYKQVMFIETALKNRVLQLVIDECSSHNFNDIFDQKLTYHNSISNVNRKKKALKKRLELRKKVLRIVADNYDKNKIVTHFYDRNHEVPIWGIFELLTLGEFGYFVSCLDVNTKIKSEHSIGINSSYSSDGSLTEKVIYLIKDLRNSLSHNEPIFDTRFKTGNVNSNLCNTIQSQTGVQNINFEHITDYLILVIFVLKNLGVSKTELKVITRDFKKTMFSLKPKIGASDFMKIFPTDTLGKINNLENFIKN